MVEQPENGYEDTALEIAGKGIIKSRYCMLLKSIYCFIFQFFIVIIHILMQYLNIYSFIELYINSSHFIQACLKYKMTCTLSVFSVFIVDFILL